MWRCQRHYFKEKSSCHFTLKAWRKLDFHLDTENHLECFAKFTIIIPGCSKKSSTSQDSRSSIRWEKVSLVWYMMTKICMLIKSLTLNGNSAFINDAWHWPSSETIDHVLYYPMHGILVNTPRINNVSLWKASSLKSLLGYWTSSISPQMLEI